MFVYTIEDIGALIVIGLVLLLIIIRIIGALILGTGEKFLGIGERILRRGMKEEDDKEVDDD